MPNLTLKVRVHATNQSKTIKFDASQTVAQAVQVVVKKIGEKDAGNPALHGLYVPKSNKEPNPRWLPSARVLYELELRDGTTVEYRKKERPLKVKLEDGTVKTVVVDDTAPVERLVQAIGKKMGLKNPEEFSLQADGKEDWLHKNLPLHDQGVAPTQAVVLKKKFFVYDANIDRSDPVQLHLVYAQCVNSITKGDHPLTDREAGHLAALQMQILAGNYNPAIHTPGFLEKEKHTVLPPQKRKGSALSNTERELLDEYKKLVGMTEVNAKFRYIQDCRKLKTYGITMFEVDRKVAGKKKPLKLMLGVTRDAVLTIDKESREIIREYPLTHLRRWAAATKSFTLDFGDYEDDYMTLLTPEAEAISQLIGGYIDILLKRRKEGVNVKNNLGDEVAEVQSVSAARGMMTATGGAAVAARATAAKGIQRSAAGKAQPFRYTSGPAGQQILVSGLQDASRAVLKMNQDALQKGAPGELTRDQFQQELLKASDAAQKHAATLSQQVETAAPDDLRAWGNIDAAARDLGMDVGALLNAARGLAAEGNPDLLNAARAVAEHIAKMLQAAEDKKAGKPGAGEAYITARQQFEAASAALAATAHGVLADPADSALLLAAAKGVASATAELLRQVREGESAASMAPAKKGAALAAADDCDDVTRNLVSAANILAPVAADKRAQEALKTQGTEVKRANAALLAKVKAAEMAPDSYKALIQASKEVSDAIARMLAAADGAEQRPTEDVALANAIKRYTTAAGNAAEAARLGPRGVMDATKKVAGAQNELLGHVKHRASALPEGSDREALLAAAKGVAGATQGVVDAAKVAAKNSKDAAAANGLRQAGAEAQRAGVALQQAVGDAASPMVALKSQIKYAGAAMAELAAATPAAKTGDVKSDTALLEAAAKAADAIAKLLMEARAAGNGQPAYAKLTEQTRAEIPAMFQAVTAAKRHQPRVRDVGAKHDLGRAAAEGQVAIRRLGQVCAGNAASAGSDEFAQAERMGKADIMELESALARAQAGQLHSGSTQDDDTRAAAREGALQLLTGAAKDVAHAGVSTAKSLATPAALPTAARATAVTASQVASAARALADAVDDRETQVSLLQKALAATGASGDVVSAARAASMDPHDAANRRGIAAAAKLLAEAVADLLKQAKKTETSATEAGLAVLDKAMRQLGEDTGAAGSDVGNWKSTAARVTATAKSIESSGQALAEARNKSSQDAAATRIVQRVPLLVAAANGASMCAPDAAAKANVISATRAVLQSTSDMFDAANAARSGDKEDAAALLAAAKALADSVAALTRVAETLSPLERAIEDAMLLSQDQLSLLASRNLTPGSTAHVTYQQATDAYTKSAKDVLRAMAALQQGVKAGAGDIAPKFTAAAKSLRPFVEATALAGAVSPEKVRAEFHAASEAVAKEAQKLIQSSRANVLGGHAGSSTALTEMAGQYKATAGSVKSLIDAVAAGATGARAIEAGLGVLERMAAELDAGIFDTGDFAAGITAQSHEDLAKEISAAGTKAQAGVRQFGALQPGVDQDTLGTTAQGAVTAVGATVAAVKKLAQVLAQDESAEAKAQQAAVVAGAQRLISASRDVLKAGDVYFADASATKAKQVLVQSQNGVDAALRSLTNALAARDASEGEKSLADASSQVQELLAQLKLDAANGSSKATAGGEEASIEADDVIGCGRTLAQEAAGLLAVSDDDALVDSSQLTVSAVQSLVDTVLQAIHQPKVQAGVRGTVANAASGAIDATVHLLNARKEHAARNKPETQRLVSSASNAVVQRVNELSSACSALPRTRTVVLEEDDAKLEDAAESELAACAKAIAEAASVLEARPRRAGASQAGLDAFDAIADAILDAATAIALATQGLVRSATKAQREISLKGKSSTAVTDNVYRSDPAWARGLISAAQAVAGGVKHLVAAANRAAEREGSEEELVATGRQVNAATVRLVSAARVKCDPNSRTTSDLSTAATDVQRANAEMVEAAKQYAEATEEAEEDDTNLGTVAKIRRQREQAAELERLKALLASKEAEYLAMNKEKYRV